MRTFSSLFFLQNDDDVAPRDVVRYLTYRIEYIDTSSGEYFMWLVWPGRELSGHCLRFAGRQRNVRPGTGILRTKHKKRRHIDYEWIWMACDSNAPCTLI